MNTSVYKSYQRGYREQYSDESFKDGIVYTKAPLDVGKARLIVNYTIEDNGESLRVRDGFHPVSFTAPFNLTQQNFKADTVLGVVDNVTEDGYQHRLTVVGDTSTIAAGSNGVVDGSMIILDTCEQDDFSEFDSIFADSEYQDMSVKSGYGQSINSKYYVIDKPVVHGKEIPRYCRAIGCFGFNGDYFFFNNSGQLCRTVYSTATHSYLTTTISPKEKSVSEAMNNGFNMLLPAPYTFTDHIADTNMKISFDGIFVNDASGIVVAPFINTTYNLRLYYNAKSGEKYKVKFSYKGSTTEEFTLIEEKEYTISSTSPVEMSVPFKSPIEDTIIKAEAYHWNGSAYDEDFEAVSYINVVFYKEHTTSAQSKELIKYDLSEASNMFFWNDRLWVYGIKEGNTILFSSAYNDPTYFPYINASYFLHERILKCVPFNDSLLLFTPTKLLQGKYENSQLVFKTLQSNLVFDEYNVELVQIIKTMVFFQSGNYYYMIVPKTLSLQQELALAPVSTNITYFLDDFYTNATAVIRTLYNLPDSQMLNIQQHYNYLNYEDMHNVYSFIDELTGKIINFDLIYNTNDRNWKMFIYQNPSAYIPVKQDATNDSELICITPVDIVDKHTFGITSLYPDSNDVKDLYLPSGVTFTKTGTTWDSIGATVENLFKEDHIYKNYQMFDTGYRNNSLDLKKRYRELQIKFNNTEGYNLGFHTEFILDGETRIGYYKYTVETSEQGVLTVVRTPIVNLELRGTTILAEDMTEEEERLLREAGQLNYWSLDVSGFPEIAFYKARFKVSGKGYTPRFRLVSNNEHRYEILGYVWVYRMMYSR